MCPVRFVTYGSGRSAKKQSSLKLPKSAFYRHESGGPREQAALSVTASVV